MGQACRLFPLASSDRVFHLIYVLLRSFTKLTQDLCGNAKFVPAADRVKLGGEGEQRVRRDRLLDRRVENAAVVNLPHRQTGARRYKQAAPWRGGGRRARRAMPLRTTFLWVSGEYTKPPLNSSRTSLFRDSFFHSVPTCVARPGKSGGARTSGREKYRLLGGAAGGRGQRAYSASDTL